MRAHVGGWLSGLVHLVLGAAAMLAVIAFVHVGIPIYFRVRGEPRPAVLLSSTARIEEVLGCRELTFSERLAVSSSGGIFRSSEVLYVEGDEARVRSLRERCGFDGTSDSGRMRGHPHRVRSIRVGELQPGRYFVSITVTRFGGPS